MKSVHKEPWIGDIPDEWALKAIKRIVSIKVTDGPHETPELEDSGVQFISAEAIKNNRIDFNQRRGFISQELHEQYCRKCKPQRGDIFVIKSGATTGNVAFVDVDFEFSIWSPLALIRCNHHLALFKYVFYVLLSDVFRKQVELSWSFGTQQNIGMGVIECLKIPLPPMPEQQRIAAYLDASCAAVDAALSAKRRQLETLDDLRRETITRAITLGLKPSTRTKASGEDYIGDIPAHWSAPSLKRLLSEPLTYGLNEAAELEERDLPRYLRITDFDDDGTLRDDTFRSLPREIACEALLKPNDVLFARSGATVGKTFMFRNYEGEACFAGYLIRARTLPWKLDPLFLYLFTKSSAYESWKNLIFTQATIQNISAAKYNYLSIPLPPLDEQRAIVAHIEKKNTEFQILMAGMKNQIAALTAYRKSLIHECVTGQRRITEADLNHVKAHG